MFMVILFLVIGVVVGGLGAYKVYTSSPTEGDSYNSKPAKKTSVGGVLMGSAAVVLGIVIAIAGTGFKEIGAGSVGIVVQFGQVQGGTLSPGLVYVLPVVANVVIEDTRVQSYNFGNLDENKDNQPDGIEAFTKEQQPAYLFGVVNYHIDPQYASELYQRVGSDYFDKVVHSQADTEIKQDARLYTVDEITSKRDELAASAQVRLTTDLAQYHIVVDGIFVSQVGLSPEYITSVENKQIAQQNILKAEADAESARQAAKGQADAQVTLAQGQADSNNLVNASLTDALIRWQSIQKLNPNVNVMLVPETGNFLFNLPTTTPVPSVTP